MHNYVKNDYAICAMAHMDDLQFGRLPMAEITKRFRTIEISNDASDASDDDRNTKMPRMSNTLKRKRYSSTDYSDYCCSDFSGLHDYVIRQSISNELLPHSREISVQVMELACYYELEHAKGIIELCQELSELLQDSDTDTEAYEVDTE
jgi:hypothetical protein